ncbi:hypothetical protein [Salipiger sp. PrR002]|uniref:hypothetical protein n=1 Tax=Salipiger sp. PrR002 TaxID=2706489 RepID=UPI0013B95003|nr:hypothetical protein [Salipiger sp. PrR002]NDW01928.1 hypothetical protein [Salipiger sp. PrR002]NDW58994.1 hypothetical protein [Salipiger sp. PrR004]
MAAFRAAAAAVREDVKVAWFSWADIARAVTKLQAKVSPAEARILSDLEKALSFFGFVHVDFDVGLKRLHPLPNTAELGLESLEIW